MKKSILLVVALLTTGCASDIDKASLNKAVEVCQPNGGIKYISPDLGHYKVMCGNNANFYVLSDRPVVME